MLSGLPLSAAVRANRNGTASRAHCSGDGKRAASEPKQLFSSLVCMMPGFTGTAAMEFGSSVASDWVSPSIAHLLQQYEATCGETDRPQPLLKLTSTP